MKKTMITMAAAAVTACLASGATAQSAYGCTNLDGFHALPSVEGREGVFFRVNPELRNFHAFSDETVEDVATLSQALANTGTTLLLAPIPPKAMVLTEHLPQRAYDYGFEPNLASSVYEDMIKRLRDAGVMVADVRRALVAGSRGVGLPYFKTDYRLNALGARLTAQSIAQAVMQAGQNAGLRPSAEGMAPRPTGQAEIESDMRGILQRHCLIELPKVVSDVYDTAQMQAVSNRGGFGGFRGPSVAIVGTSYSETPGINFAGFVESALGAPVQQIAFRDGGAYDAFLTYVTSPEFRENPPSLLIWETPVYFNLAQYGDQPIRELIAASGNSCRIPLPVMASLDSDRATIDLSSLDPSQRYTLFIEAGGTAAGEAQFTFVSPTGLTRTKTIVRQNEATRNGQFYVPMSGLWEDGARQVDIRLDASFTTTPRATACSY